MMKAFWAGVWLGLAVPGIVMMIMGAICSSSWMKERNLEQGCVWYGIMTAGRWLSASQLLACVGVLLSR